MKLDLDNLMEARDVTALLITGPAQHNAPMYYFTGGGHLTQADLIKPRGQEPILFYNPMERDEAASTGLICRDLGKFRLSDLIEKFGGDVREAHAQRYQMMLESLSVTEGRLAVYGKVDAGFSYAVISRLQEMMPALELFGELADGSLLQARATKDEAEVERIRQMGQLTVEVVAETANLLTTRQVRGEILLNSEGEPLTVGEVKRLINRWLAERGAENPEGTIFAIGRDAGVPHSTGNLDDFIRLGQTIVFDIFPCEAGGGYFYDFTRTWSLGYASDQAQALHEDVLAVYQDVIGELTVNEHCPLYQARTCDLFEQRGHATIAKDSQTQSGYVHSLGHGLGLDVHERPWFGKNASENDRLFPGAVFTVEPGLYYPDLGMGVRLEDTAWVRPDGQIEVLVPYPMDLVLPVKL